MPGIFNASIFNNAIFNTAEQASVSGGESQADIWWRRARKARAGTYLLVTEEMRKEKRKFFKKFTRHGY